MPLPGCGRGRPHTWGARSCGARAAYRGVVYEHWGSLESRRSLSLSDLKVGARGQAGHGFKAREIIQRARMPLPGCGRGRPHTYAPALATAAPYLRFCGVRRPNPMVRRLIRSVAKPSALRDTS